MNNSDAFGESKIQFGHNLFMEMIWMHVFCSPFISYLLFLPHWQLSKLFERSEYVLCGIWIPLSSKRVIMFNESIILFDVLILANNLLLRLIIFNQIFLFFLCGSYLVQRRDWLKSETLILHMPKIE